MGWGEDDDEAMGLLDYHFEEPIEAVALIAQGYDISETFNAGMKMPDSQEWQKAIETEPSYHTVLIT